MVSLGIFFPICIFQEFILRKSENQKLKAPNSQEGLLKKSLNDFHQVTIKKINKVQNNNTLL